MADTIIVTPSAPVVVQVAPVATPTTPPDEVIVYEGQPGPQGIQGEQGPAGVVGAVAPIIFDAQSSTVSIDQTAIQINATQIDGLPAVTTFVYTQNSVSSTWSITHNLGYYPQIVTQDSAGTTLEGSVTYDSPSHLTVHFSTPTTGIAYLS